MPPIPIDYNFTPQNQNVIAGVARAPLVVYPLQVTASQSGAGTVDVTSVPANRNVKIMETHLTLDGGNVGVDFATLLVTDSANNTINTLTINIAGTGTVDTIYTQGFYIYPTQKVRLVGGTGFNCTATLIGQSEPF